MQSLELDSLKKQAMRVNLELRENPTMRPVSATDKIIINFACEMLSFELWRNMSLDFRDRDQST